jgi:hypothetical protein
MIDCFASVVVQGKHCQNDGGGAWSAAIDMTESVARSGKAAAANYAHFEARFALIFRDITIRKGGKAVTA